MMGDLLYVCSVVFGLTHGVDAKQGEAVLKGVTLGVERPVT